MKLRITCKEAVDYINKQEEKKLSFLQRIKLWNHLFICVLCKRFAIQNKILTKLFRTANETTTLEFSKEEKIKIIDTLITTEE